MIVMASQITGISIGWSTVCSGAEQRKQQISVPLALWVESTGHPWIHPTKGPVAQKMFPFDDVMNCSTLP